MVAVAKPKRQRKPMTDPEQLERRRQALAKARAARAEKLAAAREGHRRVTSDAIDLVAPDPTASD